MGSASDWRLRDDLVNVARQIKRLEGRIPVTFSTGADFWDDWAFMKNCLSKIYDRYKDSGDDWLGKHISSWRIN